MILLTANFSEHELGVDSAEERIRENARFLSEKLLEPIRAHYAKPLFVHDGYRPPEHNHQVGGKPTSWHLFEGTRAAADIHVEQLPLTELFRWIRMESKLPFDKVILEHSFDGIPRCVHLQIDRQAGPRRLAYIGSTGDGQSYTPVEVA